MTIPSQPSAIDAEVQEAQQYLKGLIQKGQGGYAPAFSSIPVIDLGPLTHGSPVEKQRVAREINEACTTSGFFYIKNHGISADQCDEVLNQAQRFFKELPFEKKKEIHYQNSKFFRGWRPSADILKRSHPDSAQALGVKGVGDYKEAFNWAYQSDFDPTGGDGKYVELDGSRSVGNLWPREEDLPGFLDGVKGFYGQALQLSRRLIQLFALSLALPETTFDHLVTHPGGVARLLYYPPTDKVENLVGIGAHSDFELFTLLLQSDVNGLEVLSPDGKWVAADPLPGTIVVNVGDFMMRMTNGLYKSTIHRVVNYTGKERYSVPFFFSFNYDEIVETIPSCIPEGEQPKYKSINAGSYILERLRLALKDNE
ncbi:putative 2OG-Fe(II) oxygenase family oxidoreductase [Aspergillus nomiae NRRL 13137]|uniref:Putative 2OG-Fe(II) oxygenase family oxidoreductase n=1 Tax=Aspergillus nomiae NRRL (strain ATCC 15546 / NRRL 13137 / CBS 260.88 / M93) TaxID=1509407 RepID=A0A0L1J5I9_ASPN3|nr:putative 2OG-Fe(II) oxygenase family oxidoreductase [Aspergillus nomiae NRRL 13137]KNG87002.1 putative 2OG-Fe(II) oxygenase family oxidoreductase [Aspergillus nomiae NRRL 13137]